MESFARLFTDAGVGAYVVLLLGIAAIGAGLLGFLLAILAPRAGRIVAALALLAASLTLLAGIGGALRGRDTVEEAIVHVNPADQEAIRRQGYEEARANVVLGLGFGALPFLLGVTGVLIARRKPEGASMLGLATIGVAAASLAATLVILRQPLPGRDLTPDGWKVIALTKDLQTNWLSACLAWSEDADSLDAAARDLPEYKAAVSRCVERATTASIAEACPPPRAAEPAAPCLLPNLLQQMSKLRVLPADARPAVMAAQARLATNERR